MGNISSRPIIMKIKSTSLPGAEKPSTNDEEGPISPNPGPIFPSALNTPLKDVIKSEPRAVKIKVPITTRIPYTTTNPATRSTKVSGMVLLPIRACRSARGLLTERNVR